jgi:hypothetical protein
MAEIVNLGRVRKAKAKAAARATADQNAAKHGLTKAERHRQMAVQDKADRELSAHQRDPE